MDLKSILAVIIFVAAVRHGQTALLTTCDTEGDCQDTGGDPNAVCSKDTSNGGDVDGNCICTERFKEDNDACIAKGLGDTCSAATDCDTNVDHSECKVDTCACSDGYTQVDDACVQIYGTACSGTGSCDGLANSACAESKCACAQGFVESNNICTLTVSNTECTESGTDCPVNAMCEGTKCKCDVGFTENADKCVEESGASSTKATTGIVFGSMWILWNIISFM